MLRLVLRGVLMIFLLLISITLKGQLTEGFEDGDFTNNPVWFTSSLSGEQGDFEVVDGELRTNGPASTAKIWISTNALPDLNSAEVKWTFEIRHLSAPSGSNNVKVFLLSSKADLNDQPEGYFIRLGESGSDDGIDLMKTSSTTPIISDPNPSVSSSINTVIEVVRMASGQWILSAGSQRDSLVTIGTAVDKTFTQPGYFGFLISHTKTKNQSFFFDNIEISTADKSPPTITKVTPMNESELLVNFSEELTESSSVNETNYFINDVSPASVSLDSTKTTANVILRSPLENGSTNVLRIVGLEDVNGNSSEEDTIMFSYFKFVQGSYKDVIINEILADPTPQNDLPEAEYVELFNKSDIIFDLDKWTFCDASQCGELPSILLFPDQHVVLCSEEDIDKFSSIEGVIGLSLWPTLNNSGDQLKIRDNNGLRIDSVNYSDRWFKSSSKREGGWSLELIDPDNFCSDENNWIDSEEPRGGTPGLINSVRSSKPDLAGPEILQVLGVSPDSIVVMFNESLDLASTARAEYTFSPEALIREAVYVPASKSISIVFSEPLTMGIEYTIKVQNITDCSGNRLLDQESNHSFSLLHSPGVDDLVINEILFNPRTGGTDFIEIFNKSDFPLDLRAIKVGNFNGEADAIEIINLSDNFEQLVSIDPKGFIVLTRDALVLAEQYPRYSTDVFIEIESFPAMPDDRGRIVLVVNDSVVIDQFEYTEDFHSESINDNEGVSLERISVSAKTQDQNNWTSATTVAGYASPGVENSQSRTVKVEEEDQIVLFPKTINLSDTQNNFTTISYNLSESGGLATLKVFDVYGRLVATVADNELVGTEGIFKWDGYTDEGQPVRMGYYIIYLEVFYSKGEVKTFKRKVAVTDSF